MHYTRHGYMTACGKPVHGLLAWGASKVKATGDPLLVTCRKCLGHMRKEQRDG